MVVFSRGRLTTKDVFQYEDEVLNTVNSFKYLSVEFSKLVNFAKCKKDSFDRVSKAMFSLIQSAIKKDLPMHARLDLFGKMVVPVLLYRCDV